MNDTAFWQKTTIEQEQKTTNPIEALNAGLEYQLNVMLQEIKAEFPQLKFSGIIGTDFTLFNQPHIGGYYIPGSEPRYIGINLYTLITGDLQLLKHVMVHELVHAGAFTDGVEVLDEAATESITKELLGQKAIVTAYEYTAISFTRLLGETSYTELAADQNEQTLVNILLHLSVGGEFAIGSQNFSYENISQRYNYYMAQLQFYLPRLFNFAGQTNINLYSVEQLFWKSTSKLILESGQFANLLINTPEILVTSEEKFVELLSQSGYFYLLQYQYSEAMDLFRKYRLANFEA